MGTKTVYMITTAFYPSIGGLENHIYNLSRNLIEDNDDFRVKIIYPMINIDNTEIELLDGIEIHRIAIANSFQKNKYDKLIGKSSGSLLGYFNGYRRKLYLNKFSSIVYEYIERDIKSEKKDFIIHQHDFISSITLVKKLSKKYKIIFTNHTGEYLFLKKLPISKKIIKFLTYQYSHIIAPSDELADFKGTRDLKTITYLPNGVETRKYNNVTIEEKNNIRERLNIDTDKLIVFSPRRWAPTKGILFLVKAIDIIVNKYNIKNIIFMFAGNDYTDYPQYREAINEIILRRNLEAYIDLRGNIDYSLMDQYMKASDVVVIPSLMEAVSLAALEAMACCKVIVATRTGGLLQIFENKKNGFLVNPENEVELADELKYIYNNFDSLEYIGKNAREFVENGYSWKKITKDTIKIYNKNTNIFIEEK